MAVPTTVPFNLVGTARENIDFTLWIDGEPLVSPLVIPAGAESVDVEVIPLVTDEMERTEWVSVGLQASPDVVLNQNARRARVWVYEFGPSTGETFYVSPDGSDEGMGSEDEPFATIGYALGRMQAGDTLYLFVSEY